MLYNIKDLPGKLASMPDYRQQKTDIVKFFLPGNLINNLNINKFYMTDNHPFCFVDESTLIQICKEAEKKFSLNFDINRIYKDRLISFSNENNIAQEINIKNIESYNNMEKWHEENSKYGKKKQEDHEKRKQRKEKENQIKLKEVEDRRLQEKNEYKKEANLLINFNDHKLVTIDMEFSYFKDKNYYMVTELGITTLENGNEKNEHYLISENYKRKYNRVNQDKFMFGKTQLLNEKEIITTIKERLKNTDFIVFHEQREDMEILKTLGLENNYLKENNIQLLDTKKAFNINFKKKGDPKISYSIEDLLDVFKVKNKYLHNAGNDAKYTTDLLLKMSEIAFFLKKQYSDTQDVDKKRKLKM